MKKVVSRGLKKMLSDFQEQLGKPFEYEARLKELLAKQADLNAALDLDKGERQVAPEEAGDPENSDNAPAPAGAFTYDDEQPVSAHADKRGADRTAWQARETPRRRQRVYKPPILRPRL